MEPASKEARSTVTDETPDTDTVRFWYAQPTGGGEALPHLEAEFDRWLAQERAEAGAQAVSEMGDWFMQQGFDRDVTAAQACYERATRLRGGNHRG